MDGDGERAGGGIDPAIGCASIVGQGDGDDSGASGIGDRSETEDARGGRTGVGDRGMGNEGRIAGGGGDADDLRFPAPGGDAGKVHLLQGRVLWNAFRVGYRRHDRRIVHRSDIDGDGVRRRIKDVAGHAIVLYLEGERGVGGAVGTERRGVGKWSHARRGSS